ncbi:MAG: DUF4126 domain-containing protein [Acidobacteria bacterium]|nr:DUF4126 domain-containing protein [Acidobacteriota bacterium]
MELLLSVCLGVGLSAACGFRIFVPVLIMGMAARSGHLQLADSFVWIGSTPALIGCSVATALEIGAYYIPWLDNLLDTVATPAAVVAGIVVTASCVVDLDPVMRWTLASILGGGSAAVVQTGTSLLRATSSATTGGLGNPLVATAEAGGSIGLSLVSLLMPVIAALLFLSCIGLFTWWWMRRRNRRLTMSADRSDNAL